MQTIQGHAATAAHDGRLFRAALVVGAVFLLWRAARGLKGAAWSAFALALASRWTGLWPW
ncbi:hypothetical protein QF205_13650 [Luteimonas composti]|uniref:Uncharacterized protein n=1 Tax=Luteimonas composti TaxID=398257 RepID=A0ABT6MV24_9GAMM|nr:hypothetical protein [Luteimonas composti]MDH7454106.1 hypothetical protein [Luteimonas composti]